MRPLRLVGLLAMVFGALLAAAGIAFAGYARGELLPYGMVRGDPSGLYLMRYGWAAGLAGTALALAGSIMIPRAERA